MLLFLRRQIRNDTIPSAIAATDPRPAPRPIARGEVFGDETAVADVLGLKVEAGVMLVEVVFDAPVAFGSSVLTGRYDDAVVKTNGFPAVNSKSSMTQHVVLV
jgi:hypothetical protein